MWQTYFTTICLVITVADCGCRWEGPQKNKGIPSNATDIHYNCASFECRKACEEETEYRCLSIEYHSEQRFCYLKTSDRHGMVLVDNRGFDYYELRCSDPCKDLGVCVDDKSTQFPTKAIITLRNLCLCDCITLCQSQSDFHCTAIKYKTFSKRCILMQSSISGRPAKVPQGFLEGGCSAYKEDCNTKECVHANIYQYPEPSECLMVQDQGHCKKFEQRYFYNYETKDCEPFTYGGCGGNGNNFESHFDCRTKCVNHY